MRHDGDFSSDTINGMFVNEFLSDVPGGHRLNTSIYDDTIILSCTYMLYAYLDGFIYVSHIPLMFILIVPKTCKNFHIYSFSLSAGFRTVNQCARVLYVKTFTNKLKE